MTHQLTPQKKKEGYIWKSREIKESANEKVNSSITSTKKKIDTVNKT